MRVNEEKFRIEENKKIRKKKNCLYSIAGNCLQSLLQVLPYAWSRISKAEDAIHQKVETVQLREKELTDDSSFRFFY